MHAHDKSWVRQQMNKLPSNLKGGAATAYQLVFEHEGRTAANTRLRKYVERVNNK